MTSKNFNSISCDIPPHMKTLNTVIPLLYLYLSIITSVLGAQKNRLIETVLLSTHKVYI